MDNKIIDNVLAELDQMLAEHEKFKEEYGKKYEGLTREQKIEEQIKELELTKSFIEKTNMKVENVELKD